MEKKEGKMIEPPPDPVPLLAVVIFGFNEAETVRETVEEARAFLEVEKLAWEILLVDDGSTDGTGRIMDEIAAADSRIRAVHHETNRGIGAALKTGFAGAEAELVAPIPADGQIPASAIGDLLKSLGHAELVISTYRHRGDGAIRSSLSLLFRGMTRAIAGVDPQTHGFYVARRSLVSELRPESDSFFYNIELPILALRAGRSVVSVAIDPPRPRRGGQSKVLNAKRLAHVVKELVLLRRRMSQE